MNVEQRNKGQRWWNTWNTLGTSSDSPISIASSRQENARALARLPAAAVKPVNRDSSNQQAPPSSPTATKGHHHPTHTLFTTIRCAFIIVRLRRTATALQVRFVRRGTPPSRKCGVLSKNGSQRTGRLKPSLSGRMMVEIHHDYNRLESYRYPQQQYVVVRTTTTWTST